MMLLEGGATKLFRLAKHGHIPLNEKSLGFDFIIKLLVYFLIFCCFCCLFQEDDNVNKLRL